MPVLVLYIVTAAPNMSHCDVTAAAVAYVDGATVARLKHGSKKTAEKG